MNSDHRGYCPTCGKPTRNSVLCRPCWVRESNEAMRRAIAERKNRPPCEVPGCNLHVREGGARCVMHEPRNTDTPRATDYLRRSVWMEW